MLRCSLTISSRHLVIVAVTLVELAVFYSRSYTSSLTTMAPSTFIISLWCGRYELMGEIYARYRSFGTNGSHHYAGSFRSIISMFDEDENREACLQAVHIFRHNNPSDYRTELVNEARLVIRGNNVTYRNLILLRILS